MPGKIRLLSDDIIGKIAAGEVVERPSAAIKEMVENSLDAGATAVTVEIRDGGISYFRVTDNGSGIQQSEIRMAFERHATSKISSAQELSAIQTLGFRGEALASIAAVAKVTCTTRTKTDSSGIKVVNSGGRIESIEETACPEGTTFVVRDLFYNTPVRLKFLKKPITETGYISDLMMRLILSRPDVSFRYISQGKTLYHSAGDGKLSSAVFSIYGKELRSMQEVNGHQSGVIVKGYVGVGDVARATRSNQSFFINGRYMKSALLSAAVENACRERTAHGRYPTCVLHLTMPFEMVDVNVHPNKLECRFQDETALSAAVESLIAEAFVEQNPLDNPALIRISSDPAQNSTPVLVKKQDAVQHQEGIKAPQTPRVPEKAAGGVVVSTPQASHADVINSTRQSPVIEDSAKLSVTATLAPNQPVPSVQKTSQVQKQPPLPAMKPLQPVNNRPKAPVLREPPVAVQAFLQSYQQLPPVYDVSKAPLQENTSKVLEQSFLPEVQKPLRIIGQVFNSYILVEYQDHLLLIDQQGVHERLLYDRMVKALDHNNCSQELLIPLVLPATRKEQQLLEANRDVLSAIGLCVDSFGETEVAIRSIPMILGQPQAVDFLQDVIDQLENERAINSVEKRRSAMIALACKKSVRINERLTEEDLRELVVRMVEKKVIPASPRGTPLVFALTHSELDRRFRRSQ